jgi:hypothetical protein
MRVRVVVLLADEYGVGARQIREHRFEVAEVLLPRVEDALRHVGIGRHRRRGRWRRSLKQREESRREQRWSHLRIVSDTAGACPGNPNPAT